MLWPKERETNISNKHKMLEKGNSAGYLHGTVMELNSGQPRINPVNSREEDLNLGPLDYKSSALTTGPHHLLPSEISVFNLFETNIYTNIYIDTWLLCSDMSTHKIVLLFQHGLGHPGNKSSHVVFLGDMNMLFTTGFSRMNERQVAIWDVVRNFKRFLLKKITIAFVTRVGQRKYLRYHRN